MARPNKEGLDYFPLDCKMDDKVYMVEVELGLEGFALFIKLLMKIYNENYYIEWTERKAKIFANQNNTNIDVVNKLINVCLSEDLFDKKLYKKYQILTSNGIQKRYFHSIKTRKDIFVIKEYLINGIDNYLDNLINVNINSINKSINSIKDKHNPHSIVKESKVNNIKEKKKYLDVVLLTEDEYKKLIDKFGEVMAKDKIEGLSLYIQKIGDEKAKKYKSHYATILCWDRKNKKQSTPNKRNTEEEILKIIGGDNDTISKQEISNNSNRSTVDS